jgi:hypothetical protein
MSLQETATSVAEPLDADLRVTLQRRLPVLLHVQAVRIAGPNLSAEALAYFLWQRTLEGIAARTSRRG